MLPIKMNIRVITALFILAISSLAFADEPTQTTRQSTTKTESKIRKDFQHYEGDMPDNLANPQDSTNEELDEETEELDALQKQRKATAPVPPN